MNTKNVIAPIMANDLIGLHFRSPRLRFALELAKSNRAHWKANAKDLASNCRPYQNATFYGGKSHTQFYLAEMKKFVSKPLHSR